MNDLAALLPLVAILALFWFMVVRPQQRRQKAVVALQQSIEVGQRVMMSSGIYGTVRSIDDERARLEIAPGTEIEITLEFADGSTQTITAVVKAFTGGEEEYAPEMDGMDESGDDSSQG